MDKRKDPKRPRDAEAPDAAADVDTEAPVAAPDVHPFALDVLFYCAKSTERDALLHALADKGVRAKPKGHGGLMVHTFRLDNGLAAGVCAGTRQGPETAALETAHAMHVLRPTTTVMVGICCAYEGLVKKEKVSGEPGCIVILAATGVNISEGKNTLDGPQPRYSSNEIRGPAKLALQAAAGIEAGGPARVEAIMLTSSRVEEAFTDGFKDAARHFNTSAQALDMETSAFIHAVNTTDVAACLGVVKSVSDFGTDKSREEFKRNEYAATKKCVYDAFVVAKDVVAKYFEADLEDAAVEPIHHSA